MAGTIAAGIFATEPIACQPWAAQGPCPGESLRPVRLQAENFSPKILWRIPDWATEATTGGNASQPSRPSVAGSRGLKRTSDFFNLEGFQRVAFLDVIEALELDPALHAPLDFAGIILFPLQRFDGILANHPALANHPNSAIALNASTHHAATGNGSHLRHVEDLQNHGHSLLDHLLFRFEATFQGSLNIVSNLVNDVVTPDFNLQLIGQRPGDFVGDDIEANDDRLRRLGQADVSQSDSTDECLQNIDSDFRVLDLGKLFLQRFDRTSHIRA